MDVVIVGAGIGGLTLALELHAAGIECRVYEAVADLAPLGVGINILPHAMGVLNDLGMVEKLSSIAVVTKEAAYFNRFGQLISREPVGRYAGYGVPQLSIHRGDLQMALLAEVQERLGSDAVVLGHRCTSVIDEGDSVRLTFVDPDGRPTADVRGSVAIACDGVNSVIRKQLNPDEGEPLYSGINMWRGVTRTKPFLSGATMVRAGWLETGKMVIYPIKDNIDASGNQLVNWVAEVATPAHITRDWNRRGDIADFIDRFADWHFDWLDVPSMIRDAESVLEYPMVDQDPLNHWTEGRVTLLGDAAHPMVPRGSNGAGQSILDARALRLALADNKNQADALLAYENERRPLTSQVVFANRIQPPDILLKEVYDRTGDAPFHRIEDVISADEILAISDRYKQISGMQPSDS